MEWALLPCKGVYLRNFVAIKHFREEQAPPVQKKKSESFFN